MVQHAWIRRNVDFTPQDYHVRQEELTAIVSGKINYKLVGILSAQMLLLIEQPSWVAVNLMQSSLALQMESNV